MNIPSNAFFGASIARARTLYGYSPEALAADVGISAERLLEMERGARLPSAEEMARIICRLRLTPDWLFFLNDPDTAERMDGIARLIRCMDGDDLDRLERYIVEQAREKEKRRRPAWSETECPVRRRFRV